MSSSDLYKQYMKATDNAYNSLIEFGEESAKIPPEERRYSAKNYEKFVSEFDEVLKKKRDEIRLMMKIPVTIPETSPAMNPVMNPEMNRVTNPAMSPVMSPRKQRNTSSPMR